MKYSQKIEKSGMENTVRWAVLADLEKNVAAVVGNLCC